MKAKGKVVSSISADGQRCNTVNDHFIIDVPDPTNIFPISSPVIQEDSKMNIFFF